MPVVISAPVDRAFVEAVLADRQPEGARSLRRSRYRVINLRVALQGCLLAAPVASVGCAAFAEAGLLSSLVPLLAEWL
ncbi:hypothetical protein, partial [Streptomyces sp. NPDC001719]